MKLVDTNEWLALFPAGAGVILCMKPVKIRSRLFPAGAGVILSILHHGPVPLAVPRRGGGDPLPVWKTDYTAFCSPQGRG